MNHHARSCHVRRRGCPHRNVPDACLIELADALVAVTRASICGSDLWPYKTMEHSDSGRGRRMGHEGHRHRRGLGSDVRTLKVGDVVVVRFAYSEGRPTS